MPKIGVIYKAREIGKGGTGQYIWVACPKCGKEHWVSYRFYKEGKYKERGMCHSCAFNTPKNFNTSKNSKGGFVDRCGYRHVFLKKIDFFYPMADHQSYVREHRLIVAKALGRCLQPWEIVHHKGDKYPIGSKEDKADNRYPENLQLTTEEDHRHLQYVGSILTCPFCKNKIRISLKLFH